MAYRAGWGVKGQPDTDTQDFDSRDDAQAWVEANVTDDTLQGWVQEIDADA